MSRSTIKNFALWARQTLLAATGREDAAYIWFNRLTALRYMEVNGYLQEADTLETMCAMEDKEEAKTRLIALCNRQSAGLPGIFPAVNEQTERLLPASVLEAGGVVERLLGDISGEDWQSGVEIIGWLHQYYNTEQKKQAFGELQKENVKLSGEKIPAATQLFTPDWIVRYLTDHSLGRLWKERHPDPRSVKFMDPCAGTGHILVYAFEVFMEMYREAGCPEAEAAENIVKDNLFGLDIDSRASQLAHFTVMMKARQYNSGILDGRCRPNIFPAPDSRFLSGELMDFVAGNDMEIKCDLLTLKEDLYDAAEYGSLADIRPVDLKRLTRRAKEICDGFYGQVPEALYAQMVREKLLPLLAQAEIMTGSYDVVATNPPYMGKSAMNKKLRAYVKKKYPLSDHDLYAVFIEKCDRMTAAGGYQAMITQQSWMFLKSYEKLRKRILQTRTIIHMLHLGTRAFEEISGEVVQTVAWVMKKTEKPEMPGTYMRLTDFGSQKEQAYREEMEQGIHHITYRRDNRDFFRIPGAPIAYWVPQSALPLFLTATVSDFATVTNGMFTCDNRRFLRFWFELPRERIAFDCSSKEACIASGKKWFPYNKGGNFRRWYGNQEYVINFENFGEEIRQYRVQSGQSAVFPGQNHYFEESLSWSLVSPGRFGIRYYPKGFVFDIAGSSIFPFQKEQLFPLLGVLASRPVYALLKVLNPTINYQAGDIRSLPVVKSCLTSETASRLDALVRENVALAKADWDSTEISWAFEKHPLVAEGQYCQSLADACGRYRAAAEERAARLRNNEAQIDRIVEEAYGFPLGEPAEAAPADTAGQTDFRKEMRSLISYGVGCMFGRFESGLPCAGQNVILLTDTDILRRLEQLVAAWFGKESLEENLETLAAGVSDGTDGGGGRTARERLLRYLQRDFYRDHARLYRKCPIYWLAESGRTGAFRALMYVHRYRTDNLRHMGKLVKELLADGRNMEGGELTARQREELFDFLQRLEGLMAQAPVLEPDDGITNNRRKLSSILKM